MKAAFGRGKEVFLKDVATPAPKPDEIRLRVTACGTCGTDLHWNSKPSKDSPFGHEVAGTVLGVGAAVSNVKVVQTLISHRFALADIAEADRGAGSEEARKVVVVP